MVEKKEKTLISSSKALTRFILSFVVSLILFLVFSRSVYRKADVYILDDPLSAVDAAVGRALFEKCINGLLRKSVVVLITHQLQYAQLADAMLVINKVNLCVRPAQC